MLYAFVALLSGLVLLIWSADKFVEAAASTAKHAGVPSLLIGMLVVGFGTSAPEMVVSAMASFDGSSDLALGNAIGSNIVNIGLILGVTAIISPISVHSNIISKELPLLIVVGILTGFLLWDGNLSRIDSLVLLTGFVCLLIWTTISAIKTRGDTLEADTVHLLVEHPMSIRKSIVWMLAGLVLLILSSRILVWGAVTIAHEFGVSDLIIGLTVIAFGTSLPEMAASIIAARRGEDDIAIGNVVGSNLFNLLAVIGIAGLIQPMSAFTMDILTRDWITMMLFTIALFFMVYGYRQKSQLGRVKGCVLIIAFVGYNTWLIASVIH